MFHPGARSQTLARRTAAIVLAFLCSAAAAAAASAATLKISVPATVKRGNLYKITLTGKFTKAEVPKRAFLISAIQYSPQPCKATAQQENRTEFAQFYFGSKGGIFESRSPFARTDSFTARAVGRRRVCAYLYAGQVRASSTTRPITTASRRFKVTK